MRRSTTSFPESPPARPDPPSSGQRRPRRPPRRRTRAATPRQQDPRRPPAERTGEVRAVAPRPPPQAAHATQLVLAVPPGVVPPGAARPHRPGRSGVGDHAGAAAPRSPPGGEHDHLRRRREPARGPPRQREPLSGPPREGPAGHARCRGLGRRPQVLHPHRHRPDRHPAGDVGRRPWRRLPAGRLHHHPAVRQERLPAGERSARCCRSCGKRCWR